MQFYPFYRFSRVSDSLQRAFTATVLSVAATVVGLLAMTLVPERHAAVYTQHVLSAVQPDRTCRCDRSLCLRSSGCTPDWTMSVQSAATPSAQAYSLVLLSFLINILLRIAANFHSDFSLADCQPCAFLPCLSALHIKRKS